MSKGLKSIGKSIGSVAKTVAPVASFIPGIGPIASAAIGAGGAALSGDNRQSILQSGLMGGLGSLGVGALTGGGGLSSILGGLGGLFGGGQQVPPGGYKIGTTVYDANGNIVSDSMASGGGGFLSGLGSLLQGGLGSLLGGGSTAAGGAQGGAGSLLPLLASGGLGYLLANQLGGGGGSAPKQQTVMDQATTDYFNRPTRTLDMDSFRTAATAAGNDPTTHAALNWDKFMRGGGYYNVGAPPAATPAPAAATPAVPAAAEGGSLEDILRRAGRRLPRSSNDIEMRLPAPGSYDIDPEALIENLPGAITEKERELLRQLGRLPSRRDMMRSMPGAITEREREIMLQAEPYARGGSTGGLGATRALPSRHSKGGGNGRADTIDAKLSDGEYVIDAETVSMLGDGSNDEGARILDDMRKRVRSHKGKALSRGQISPNAKSPLAYMKGARK